MTRQFQKLRALPSVSSVVLVNLGSLVDEKSPHNAFTQHMLFDVRRAGGLRVAKGNLVAMIEDRVQPRTDWAASMMDLHARNPDAGDRRRDRQRR